MVTLGPNLVKNLDFCLLLGIVSYNSSDITHSDFIQWVFSAIDVIWDWPNNFYPKLGFLGKNLWLKFGFWFTLRLRLKQLVWCILISFTDSCIFFFRWVHSFIACYLSFFSSPGGSTISLLVFSIVKILETNLDGKPNESKPKKVTCYFLLCNKNG